MQQQVLKVWEVDDFEIEFGVNLTEDCETDMGNVQYYTLDDGRKLKIVAKSGIALINDVIVGGIKEPT